MENYEFENSKSKFKDLSKKEPRKKDELRSEEAEPVVNQATQADAGWRSRESGAAGATQADAGWRSRESGAAGATQADAGWRSRESGAAGATQADAGWRSRESGAAGATQADAGWRSRESGAAGATQADAGWRSRESGAAGATQADAGWRSRESENAGATQADAGWRSRESGAAGATQADGGWRDRVEQAPHTDDSRSRETRSQSSAQTWQADEVAMENHGSVMRGVHVNPHLSMKEFKEAADQLQELTTSTNVKYQVKKTLSKEGGESAVLLCAGPDGKDVVAKIYFAPVDSSGSSVAARLRVHDYMNSPEGRKYTLPVLEIGLAEIAEGRYYFEIMPYCKAGDLSNTSAFTFEELHILTKHLNEMLHSIHNAGILHRDIKPANLYKLNGTVVIGDFGIAKLAESGVTNTTGGTDGYRAPESTLALTAGKAAFIFDEKSDYYSLGVTLASLYEGHFVYQDMAPEMYAIAVRQGRLPLSRMDEKRDLLENLLNGLCRYDSRFRFGYEDVCRWLRDPHYTGSIIEDEWPRPFHFMGKAYQDEKSLFEAITRNASSWEEGMAMVYGKYFEQFFISFRSDLARAAQLAEEEWKNRDRDKGLSVFLKTLYPAGPIVWKGYTFHSLRELAEKMVTTNTPAAYGEFLQNHVISHWLANTEGIDANEQTVALVNAIEAKSREEPELSCFWFGNSFAGKRVLRICEQEVSDISGLIGALFQSPKAFYTTDGYDKLMDRVQGADLYGFLYSLGYQSVVETQWAETKKCSEFEKASLLFSMLDNIAEKAKASPSSVRKFYMVYGPMGIAAYTKMLVERKQSPVYQAMDADGKQILAKIAAFRIGAVQTVDELYRAYLPLLELVNKLASLLDDNPFCITAGVYNGQGVLCRNLVGCFAFRIFDRLAPLGYHAWIENAKGGDVR